jgi:uncharacterized protein involved in exopolysaccharide biosynthesis
VSIAWVLLALLRHRRHILVPTVVGMLIGLAFALTRRPTFTTDFSFIPQASQDATRGALAGLAGQLGISLGGGGGPSQPPQFYADVLESRGVLGGLTGDSVTDVDGRRVPLSSFLQIEASDSLERKELTILALRGIVNSSVAARTTGAVTARVTTASPQASLEIARRLIEQMHAFSASMQRGRASYERRFAEARLDTARREQRDAEDSLQRFMQANREFGNASRMRFEQERLESEVALQRDVVRTLAQELEEARLREVRDTPAITLIESPILPVLRDGMGRLRTLFVWTFGPFILMVVMVITLESWRKYRSEERDDPSFAELSTEWQRARPFAKS